MVCHGYRTIPALTGPGRPQRPAHNGLIMLDRRERLIKMMQQPLPFQVLRRSAKTFRVILQPPPLDQQQVSVFVFNTALELVAKTAFHRADDGPRPCKGGLKCFRLIFLHVQHSDFKNHALPPSGNNINGNGHTPGNGGATITPVSRAASQPGAITTFEKSYTTASPSVQGDPGIFSVISWAS